MSLSRADLHIHTTDGQLNLGQVTFVDSAGIGAIIAAQRRARALGGELTLCELSDMGARTRHLVHREKVLGSTWQRLMPSPPVTRQK